MPAVIEQISIGGFGPIKEATLELSPLHALIGPNDSGKSMTLSAVSAILAEIQGASGTRFAGASWSLRTAEPKYDLGWKRGLGFSADVLLQVQQAFGRGPRLVRLDPDSMRAAYPLLDDKEPFDFLDERGKGLGRLIDGLFARNTEEHARLGDRLRSMFPTVDGFRLFTRGGGRAIGVRLKDGTEVPPEQMSEGMLYFLAFSLLPHIQKPSMLLIEEPENGLHPARIKEVVQILREVSKTTQILMATHSPLLINELEPHEVTLVTRHQSEGTRFTRMDKTPHFEERAKAWNLGELWIALSDGVSEEALLNPKRKR